MLLPISCVRQSLKSDQKFCIFEWHGVFFFLFERAQEIKRENGANPMKKCLVLTHCRSCLWKREMFVAGCPI